MKRLQALAINVVVLALAGCASTIEMRSGRHTVREIKREITKTIRGHYLLYLPAAYESENREWPLLLFLHGSGERGSEIDKVKLHGPPKLIEQGKEFPFIVISPQCATDERWTDSVDLLSAILDEVTSRFRVDKDRVYVTGLSMGGEGTWALATAYPDRFAAIAPVCGRSFPDKAERIKNVPIWVFHGAKDTVVPPEHSEKMVQALRNLGSDVRLTLYPEAAHDAWTETYDNPELYDWFLAQQR